MLSSRAHARPSPHNVATESQQPSDMAKKGDNKILEAWQTAEPSGILQESITEIDPSPNQSKSLVFHVQLLSAFKDGKPSTCSAPILTTATSLLRSPPTKMASYEFWKPSVPADIYRHFLSDLVHLFLLYPPAMQIKRTGLNEHLLLGSEINNQPSPVRKQRHCAGIMLYAHVGGPIQEVQISAWAGEIHNLACALPRGSGIISLDTGAY